MDPGLLTWRDHAALRILYRADVATTAQLTALVYHRRQTAQERLAALYSAGYLERAATPGLPLATLDERLKGAARQLGVALLD